MKINNVIVEKYAVRIVENLQKGRQINSILFEIARKYNPVLSENASDKFVQQYEPQFYDLITRAKDDIAARYNTLTNRPRTPSDKKSNNYQRLITGISDAIIKFVHANLSKDPTGYAVTTSFDQISLNPEVEVKTLNEPPANIKRLQTAHYDPSISFKGFLKEQEIMENLRKEIVNIAVNNKKINEQQLNEILGSLISGVKSMFGGEKTPKLHGYEEKLRFLFGSDEDISKRIGGIITNFINVIDGSKSKFSPAMQELEEKLKNGLSKELKSVQSDPIGYIKRHVKERHISHKDDKSRGMLGFGKSGAEKYAKATNDDMDAMFQSYMNKAEVSEEKIETLTWTQLENLLKKRVSRLTKKDRAEFINFVNSYQDRLDKRFPSLTENAQKLIKQELDKVKQSKKDVPVLPILTYLKDTFKNKYLGYLVLGAFMTASVLNMQPQHGLNADADNRAQTTMVQGMSGGTGPGPSGTNVPDYEPDYGPDTGSGPYPDSPTEPDTSGQTGGGSGYSSGGPTIKVQVKPKNLDKTAAGILGGKGPIAAAGAKLLHGSDFNKVKKAEAEAQKTGGTVKTVPKSGGFLKRLLGGGRR
jgi:hypothetical protein